ncbi:MAG: M56 family metallopeptidase [Duncaniella sp.]|nr:M56 family metallopeptidase [Duncaniella sp.]
MGTIFIYSIFSSITLAMLWLVWGATMRRLNLPAFNRKILLSIYAISLVVPPLAKVIENHAHGNVEIDLGMPLVSAVAASDAAPAATDISFIKIMISMYFVIAGMVFLYFLYGVITLLILRRNSPKVTLQSGQCIREVQSSVISPFSFLGEIYISSSMIRGENGRMLLLHESAHVNHRHWMDLLLAHVVCALQWYNPAAWKMRSDIKRIHEYEADADVLEEGVNARDYQILLLKNALAPSYTSITDNFNQNSLKSRIIMMHNSSSSPLSRLRSLSLIPVAALALFTITLPAAKAFASEIEVADSEPTPAEKTETLTYHAKMDNAADENTTVSDIYETVEVMPEYPGGMTAMMIYLSNNIRYPEKAFKENIEGRVVARFVVSAEGKMRDAEIVKGISPELDAEALRVVSSLPDFTPGYNNGNAVACFFTLPIVFKLTADPDVQPAPHTIFVNGRKYAGSTSDIAPETIERIDVVKNDPDYPDGKVMINLKK